MLFDKGLFTMKQYSSKKTLVCNKLLIYINKLYFFMWEDGMTTKP